MPTGGVGDTDHEVIFAGVNVIGDGNLQVGFIGRLAGGNHVVLVIYPGVDGGLDGLLGTVCRFGAVGLNGGRWSPWRRRGGWPCRQTRP